MAIIRAEVTGRGGTATREINIPIRRVEFPVTEIKNHTFHGEVRVPQGATWSLREGVKFERAHLLVKDAEVKILPGARIEMAGAVPAEYVGGGATYDPAIHFNDFGWWLQHGGKLTIKGSPVEAWNRTGQGFKDTDELWLAPFGVTVRSDGKRVINAAPSRWYPGMPIPRAHPLLPAAEVMNVTRDIVIKGVGHIHDHSHIPQSWEWARLEGLGITNLAFEGPVTGRYAVHRHHGRNIPGSVWRGLASIGARGRVFVPHGVDGMLLEDLVAVNSWANALWWDMNSAEDNSNDIRIVRMCVAGVRAPAAEIGGTSRFNAITLAGGLRNSIAFSVASGAEDGFDWPSQGDNYGGNIWGFSEGDLEALEGNVAHNCWRSGSRFWNNAPNMHEVRNFFAYHCGRGSENGAYRNANLHERCMMPLDTFFNQASGSKLRESDGSRIQTTRHVTAATLAIGHVRLEPGPDTWQEYDECNFGAVKVNGDQRSYWKARFLNCPGITPDKIQWPATLRPELEGSLVVIDGEEGYWEVRVKDLKVEVTERAA